VLFVLCVASFLSALNFFATSPFYPEMASDLGTTIPLLGQAITMMLIVSAVLGLVVGPLADTFGYRRLLMLGVVAISANLIGTAITPGFPPLLGLSLVGALGDALVFGLTIALASTLFAGPERRRAISWTIAALSVGAIAGVPVLTTIGDAAGWRVAIGAAGIASIAVAWMVHVALPADQVHPGIRFRARDILAAYAPLLGHAPTLRLLAVTMLRALWFLGLVTYLGAYLGDELSLTTRQVGLAYMLGGTGSTIGSFIAGTRLVERQARGIVALANVGGGLLLGIILSGSSTLVTLTLLPLSTAMASIGGVGVATLLAVESPAKAGTTMALNASLLNAGAAAGAAIGGALIAVGGYGSMGIGLPAFAFAAAIVAWWPGGPSR
jgi:predicted MFS family arabinose efflux permease